MVCDMSQQQSSTHTSNNSMIDVLRYIYFFIFALLVRAKRNECVCVVVLQGGWPLTNN